MTDRPGVFWIDLGVIAALIALLLFAVANPDMEQFQGKAMNAQAAYYPISTVVVPVAWWILTRKFGKSIDYPYALDILVVMPLLIGTARNALIVSCSSLSIAAHDAVLLNAIDFARLIDDAFDRADRP